MAKYRIIRVDDVSYGHPILVRRLVYRVTVRHADQDYLQKIVGRVLSPAKRRGFNALSILMYHEPSEVDGPYTVAEAIVAPHGDWARAHEVKTGDYDAMQLRLNVRVNP